MNIFKKTEAELKKIEFFNSLDSIYKDSKGLLKGWGTKQIPTDLLTTVIKAHMYDIKAINKQLKSIKANNNETKSANSLSIAYNNTLTSLISTCSKQAEAIGKKSIPLSVLKADLNYIKKAFNSGL